ncbi:28042_t:CDS:2 [Gigaspora margarita]|uniref:28042_t:CDS:1 n=1 Tax=Gigaspora margarita TaxID=4874 RepID=A0ABN7UUN7_GIGMA|nr:28042_t:CDS:2 [Gigaspora margarita]
MTDSEYYNCLSRDILKLLEDPRDYDMIITVGEDPDIKTYFVHSNILRVRSDYFKTALSSGWVKKENETIQFTKPNISPAVFDIILRHVYILSFIYGGKVVFGKNQDPQLVFDCVIAADELAILELLKYAQNYLLENQINWLKENLALIYLRSFGIESLKELQEFNSSNFLEKVAPFKISLGTLYDEIGLKSSSKKSLPSRGSIVSTIMSYQHAAIIASWIDPNSDNFVGGYNPEVWDSPLWPNYKSSDKAFIFSFTQGGTNLNGQGNNNGKIGRVIDNVYALNCWRFNGPSFGKYDLVMHYGGFLRFKHQTFSPQVLPIDNALMRIEDYEVFEVIS